MTGVRRAAAALSLLLLALGCSKGSTVAAPTPDVTTVGQSASASATVPFTTSSPTDRTTQAPGSKDFGYFTKVDRSSPPTLEFDRALFLTGAAADKASAAHGGESPVPNDYYVVNDNKLLRTLRLADDVTVIGSLQLNSYVTKDDYSNVPKKHTLKDLLGFLGTAEGPRTGWHLTYGSGGVVTRVEEQYVP